jgi:DDE superfamily endonuclease/Helix-turn-helix of DDE superfamily endonuclease
MFFAHMDINKVLNNPRLVRALLGVTKSEFLALLPTFEQVVREQAESKNRLRAVGGGCNGNIKSPARKLFFILFYTKCYPTFDAAAFVFASSKSRTNGWVHTILPLLEKTLGRKIVLPKRQIRTPEEFFAAFPGVQEVMIDGVERPLQRPSSKKAQTKHYSGKKKRHTRKNLVVVDEKKRILVLTPSKNGKTHDKRLADKTLLGLRLPPTVSVLADTGFQGLSKQHANTLIPTKKPRGGFLTDDEKAMNHLISSYRIVVEHAIGGMKRFRSVSDTFRNKKGFDDQLVRVAAGLWNFHLQMS